MCETTPITPRTEEERIAWLNQVVAELGQAEVARRLNVSSAQISRIRHGTYPSPLGRFWRQFESLFTPGKVQCPELGEIVRGICKDWREAPFAATNPLRVALYRACRLCPHNPNIPDGNDA